MTFEQTGHTPVIELASEAHAERVFYHTYVDHYRIADHYVAQDLAPDDLEEFAEHLDGCQECADRVLLAEMFREQVPKPRRSVKQAISETAREIVEQVHPSSPPVVTESKAAEPIAKPTDREVRTPVLWALAHSEKLTHSMSQPPAEKKVSATRAASVAPQPNGSSGRVQLLKPATPSQPKTFLCTYDADRRGCRILAQSGSSVRACSLPLRARIVARMSPMQLVLLFGVAALAVMAIPCALFLYELARIARR
ncbi:MAG: hypothetical protein ABI824_16230 [Acidobacteriota bacterium]